MIDELDKLTLMIAIKTGEPISWDRDFTAWKDGEIELEYKLYYDSKGYSFETIEELHQKMLEISKGITTCKHCKQELPK